jgi:hypothetical protein
VPPSRTLKGLACVLRVGVLGEVDPSMLLGRVVAEDPLCGDELWRDLHPELPNAILTYLRTLVLEGENVIGVAASIWILSNIF